MKINFRSLATSHGFVTGSNVSLMAKLLAALMRRMWMTLSVPLNNFRKPKSRFRRRIYLLFLFASLLLLFYVHRIISLFAPHWTIRYLPQSVVHHRNHRVSVWYPRFCKGATFQTAAAKHSPDRFPYAVIRDAIVDRRPAVAAFFRKPSSPSLIRITLFITVHNSAKIFLEGSNVTVIAENDSDRHSKAAAKRLSAYVEYVVHGSGFLLRKKPYTPGTKTVHGRQTTDWHVGLVLQLSNDPYAFDGFSFENAADFAVTLLPSITVRHYDGMHVPFHPRLPLACIQGWTPIGVSRAPNCTVSDPFAAHGAALFSGSALYGPKNKRIDSYREVAHFAARALMGPIRYDTVVMSVVMSLSVSDAEASCGFDMVCREKMRNHNVRLLENVATEVEHELNLIGMPEHVARNIIIIPSCTLGSATERAERGDACAISKHYGQYWATVFTYASLAPYFRVSYKSPSPSLWQLRVVFDPLTRWISFKITNSPPRIFGFIASNILVVCKLRYGRVCCARNHWPDKSRISPCWWGLWLRKWTYPWKFWFCRICIAMAQLSHAHSRWCSWFVHNTLTRAFSTTAQPFQHIVVTRVLPQTKRWHWQVCSQVRRRIWLFYSSPYDSSSRTR